MILLSELSRRRIRSINKLIRVGRSECVVVIRVDKDKGYIDLSKRRVSPEDINRCEEKFAKAKAVCFLYDCFYYKIDFLFALKVHSILRHVAEILGYNEEQLEELYAKTAWHFDAKKQASSYDIFKKAVKYDILCFNLVSLVYKFVFFIVILQFWTNVVLMIKLKIFC